MFDSAMFVVSGELLFGTTYKFAVTLPEPQLHMVNEVITVFPILVYITFAVEFETELVVIVIKLSLKYNAVDYGFVVCYQLINTARGL